METYTRTGDWRVATLGTAVVQSRFRTLARPATPFELMDDAVSYYRENFRPLFYISLWVYLIPTIVSILLLLPAVYYTTAVNNPFVYTLLDVLVNFGLLPYLLIAPMIHAGFTTLAFRMLAVGEPITLRSLWARLKPRFWRLVGNQLLASIPIGGVIITVGIGWFLAFIAVAAGAAALAPGVTGLILATSLGVVVSIVALVLLALGCVWFLILPQIVVLENTDAITAFSRAFDLIRPNLRHAVLSLLAFWGIQAVFTLAVGILLLIILAIAAALLTIYTSFEELRSRWLIPLGQAYEAVSYISYMLVMPAMYLTSILFYFDLRYRREGLDIYEVLRQAER
ncbi:MAG: hypothetical protein NZ874_05780 [Fimbriimonadales bacterium]|nr:hypothetical protein [Fimbriimonadales bacterium]